MKTGLKCCAVLGGFLLATLPKGAYACEKCFGAAGDSPTVRGIGFAMLTLLCLTVVVWGGIILFFSNMEKRSHLLASGALSLQEDASQPVEVPAEDLSVDTLLDKINLMGYECLTPEEQAYLRLLAQ